MTDPIPDDQIAIGQIVAPHGIRGELRVRLQTDFPDRLRAGRPVIVGGTPRTIQRARVEGQVAILAFAGIDDRDAAETLRDQWLTVPKASLPKLEDDAFYYHEILGLRAETPDGRVLGTVTDILETGANDVYIVTTPDGDLLIPAIHQVVTAIEPAAGRIVVVLMDGMEPR